MRPWFNYDSEMWEVFKASSSPNSTQTKTRRRTARAFARRRGHVRVRIQGEPAPLRGERLNTAVALKEYR
ncbi:MAG: hypothetical protein IIC18_10265 [Bacteroidetes bacterium]|nr:hypothetical protein [Bacteroidota bacterium]